MKHGRKPTRREKIMLNRLGYIPSEFLRVRKTAEFYEFLQVRTGKILTVRH